MVFEALQRGELVEPFGPGGRLDSPFRYWLVVAPASRTRAEVSEFCEWVQVQARQTRQDIGALPVVG
jgi:LysR family glycine cleavage system transcriptional activator